MRRAGAGSGILDVGGVGKGRGMGFVELESLSTGVVDEGAGGFGWGEGGEDGGG